MGVAGSPDEEIAQAKASPIWATLRPLAHTLAYDAACLNDGSPPDERLARIRQPVLLITGRPGTAPDVEFFGAAADAAAQAIPSVPANLYRPHAMSSMRKCWHQSLPTSTGR